MNGQSRKYPPFRICLFLVLAIVAIYWPVYNYEFVKYDDDTYVTDNANIKSGLNLKTFRWAFTTGHASNWHPVTWLSHALDYQLFDGWAGGHHLINVLLHIANTLILFYVLILMTGAIWPSVFVAAAFALHPLHVESVAWVAERKDLLSTLFLMLTIWAYIRYVENPRALRYFVTIALFALGLMAKPMLVTIPFVLLLLDFWPLHRKISYRLLVEKIPFFIFSFASCVVTFLVQRSGGTMTGIESFGLKTRISNAIVSYVTYIQKMIWPSRLAVLYPHPGAALPMTKVIVFGLLLVLASICFIYLARRYRFLAVGWFWYIGTLVPVIGLVQVGAQAMADRYTYVTLTGLFIIIAWSAKELIPKWRYKNIMFALLAATILTALVFAASRQLRYWKNSLTLFGHTLQVTKNNALILSNYATYLSNLGRLDESIEQLNQLLKIRPNYPVAHNNLGTALMKTNRTEQAIKHFRLAIKYKPNLPQAHYNLAFALKEQGKLGEAISSYRQAIKIKPDYVDAHLGLAVTFSKLKEFDKAVESYKTALQLEPDNAIARGYLGLALADIGKIDEAIEEIRFVLTLRPNDADMHRNLGVLLERKGKIAQAIESYRTALQIDPNEPHTRQLLNAALDKQKIRP